MGLPNKGKAAAVARPATRKRESRYKGISASAPRDPILGAEGEACGTYRLKALDFKESSNPRTGDWHTASFEVIESASNLHPVGSTVVTLEPISGAAMGPGLSRIKAMVVGLFGEDEAAYNEFDPDGEFLDSLVGEVNEYSERGDTLVGSEVIVHVTRGKARDKGGHYLNYSWEPAGD